MVIGKGLIAKSFESYKTNEDFLIFASGVSNSKSTNKEDYKREFDLLAGNIKDNGNKRLVYFSTCSVDDDTETKSDYIKHKKNIEAYIKSNVGSYIIFRVSNLVGDPGNSNINTVLNFFVYHIDKGINFDLWLKATRNLIGVDDFYSVTNHILQNKMFLNDTINIANPYNYPVKEIIETIEIHLNKKANYIPVDKGGSIKIDISEIESFFEKLNIQFDRNYLKKLLEKYY